MLELRRITKKFSGITAVNDVGFTERFLEKSPGISDRTAPENRRPSK